MKYQQKSCSFYGFAFLRLSLTAASFMINLTSSTSKVAKALKNLEITTYETLLAIRYRCVNLTNPSSAYPPLSVIELVVRSR